MPLILASTSRYRRELLQRLGLPFDCTRPDVDETPLDGEAPLALATRLAAAKAAEVAARHPDAWVIGSDQVADLNGQPLGKPGTVEAACAQLKAMSGHTVRFHTAISLTRNRESFTAIDLTEVRFRALDEDEIARYVAAEQPLDCAGSFKCEGLGISLFEAIDNRDPTALVGLPLIALCGLLRKAGYAVP
ncbi:septum formation inhibitor Maf [Stenotrophomonas maltophilia]|nr:septum formation inhibitor Maf [Stenotrophomonas maltophilia]